MLGFNDLMSNVGLMFAPALGGFVIDRSVMLIGVAPAFAVLVALMLALRAKT
jgi:hypothetical protein